MIRFVGWIMVGFVLLFLTSIILFALLAFRSFVVCANGIFPLLILSCFLFFLLPCCFTLFDHDNFVSFHNFSTHLFLVRDSQCKL